MSRPGCRMLLLSVPLALWAAAADARPSVVPQPDSEASPRKEPPQKPGRCQPVSGLFPGSAHGLVLRPVTFKRERRRPQTVRTEFAIDGFDGPFVLFLRNGTAAGRDRVSSATVVLNGEVLLHPSDFSRRPPGYSIPVTLSAHSLLEVTLAGDPGSELTIWVAGRPRLRVELDETRAARLDVGEEGGTLCTVGADQTEFCLTLPPKSLTEPQEITMTPIRSVPNLPAEPGFRFGVALSPTGLRLTRPAVLTVRPLIPHDHGTLLGFAFEGSERFSHFQPSRKDQSAFQVSIAHFSGYGLAAGTPADVAQATAVSPAGSVDEYQNRTSAIVLQAQGGQFTEEQVAALVAILQAWYAIVDDALTEAFSCARSRCAGFADVVLAATALKGEWSAAAELLFLADLPAIAELESHYALRVQQGANALVASLDQECSNVSDFCRRHALYLDMVGVERILQWFGFIDEIEILDPCSGVAKGIVNSVELRPETLQIVQNQEAQVVLIAQNNLREPLATPASFRVAWTASDDAVVTLRPTADPQIQNVLGKGGGSTTVTASADQCGQTFTAVATVKVLPEQVYEGRGAVAGSTCLQLPTGGPFCFCYFLTTQDWNIRAELTTDSAGAVQDAVLRGTNGKTSNFLVAIDVSVCHGVPACEESVQELCFSSQGGGPAGDFQCSPLQPQTGARIACYGSADGSVWSGLLLSQFGGTVLEGQIHLPRVQSP